MNMCIGLTAETSLVSPDGLEHQEILKASYNIGKLI